MQYRNITVLGTTVRLTNVVGSGQTQVEIPGQPVYCYEYAGLKAGEPERFYEWDDPFKNREPVEPEGTADFKAELLRKLRSHTSERLAKVVSWNTVPPVTVKPAQDGVTTVTFRYDAPPDKLREVKRLIDILLGEPNSCVSPNFYLPLL